MFATNLLQYINQKIAFQSYYSININFLRTQPMFQSIPVSQLSNLRIKQLSRSMVKDRAHKLQLDDDFPIEGCAYLYEDNRVRDLFKKIERISGKDSADMESCQTSDVAVKTGSGSAKFAITHC